MRARPATREPRCARRCRGSGTRPTKCARWLGSSPTTARSRTSCATRSRCWRPRGERRGGAVVPRDELLRAEADPIDAAEELTLRPRRLADFVGQPRLKEHLEIMLGAARRRGQAVDHLLFAGAPGLGKTTLAGIVAAELDVACRIT